MASEKNGSPAWAGARLDRFAADGSGDHPFCARLVKPGPQRPLADLADAVHHLCLLHGRRPGVIEHAGLRTAHPAARQWLLAAGEGFAAERIALTRLVVAAGPLPPTPGHAETEVAIAAQRHALDMLSQSDRTGCAIGAAMALVGDWHGVRPVMAAAAEAFAIDLPAETLPSAAETLAVAATVLDTPAAERAFRFGAEQMLAQQRGLWSLLTARAEARSLA